MTPWLPQANKERFIVQDLGNETLVYNPRNGKVTHLNEQSAAIWYVCDGTRTIKQIAEELDMTMEIVHLAIEDYLPINLVLAPPETAPLQFSRRELLFKTVVALPVITTLLTPQPAAAMSCFDPDNNMNQNPVGCGCTGANDCSAMPLSQACCGFAGDCVTRLCVAFMSVANGVCCRANCNCSTGCCGEVGGMDVCITPNTIAACQPCRANCNCVSGNCTSSTCIGTLAFGAPCTQNCECASNMCSLGNCL